MATCTRKYVAVNASFNEDGILLPRQIVWEDGRVFDIDRVLDIRTASSLKAGSGGDRFKIRVGGKETYIFFERSCDLTGNNIGRWFVEAK